MLIYKTITKISNNKMVNNKSYIKRNRRKEKRRKSKNKNKNKNRKGKRKRQSNLKKDTSLTNKF